MWLRVNVLFFQDASFYLLQTLPLVGIPEERRHFYDIINSIAPQTGWTLKTTSTSYYRACTHPKLWLGHCALRPGGDTTFPRYIFRLRSKIRQPRGQNAKLYRLAAFYPASNNVYYSTSINAKETGVIRRLIRWTHRKCFSLLQSATPKSSSFIQGDSFLLPSTRHCFIKSYIPRGMVRQPYISLLITALLYTQLLSNTKY